jgi:hypothetical protein
LILALWTAIQSALKGHWRSVISALALPIIWVLALPIARGVDRIVNDMHFIIFRHWYLAAIASDKESKGERLNFFDWGGIR